MPLTIAQEKALATCVARSFNWINNGGPDDERLVTPAKDDAIYYRMHDDPSVFKEGCPADLDKVAFGDLVSANRGLCRALCTFARRFGQSAHGRRFWRALCWLTDDFKREIEHHVGFEFADTIAPLMDPALYEAPLAAAAASQQNAERHCCAARAPAAMAPMDEPAATAPETAAFSVQRWPVREHLCYSAFLDEPHFSAKIASFEERDDLFAAIMYYYSELHTDVVKNPSRGDFFWALSVDTSCIYLLKPEVPGHYQALFRRWAKHVDPAWVNRGAYADEPAAAVQQTSPAPVAVKIFDKGVWLKQRCEDNFFDSFLVPGFIAPTDPLSAETQAYKANFEMFMKHVNFREFLPTFPRAGALHRVVVWYYENHGTPPTSTPDMKQMYKVMDFSAKHKPLLEPNVPADIQQVFKEWATHCDPYWDWEDA